MKADAYGEWMVVARKRKPNGNGKSSQKGYIREEQWRQPVASLTGDLNEIPRDTNPGSRKDMKRKANVVATIFDRGKDDASRGGSNLGQTNYNNHYSGWENSKWPSKPFNTPTPNFCFDSISSKHGLTNESLGNLLEEENHTIREINDRGDPKGLNEYHGMVQGRGHGGMEEHFH